MGNGQFTGKTIKTFLPIAYNLLPIKLMAKNKPDGLTHYELLYIVSNQFSEDELNPIKDKVEKIITDHHGSITFKEDLGKKRLAYKIKQFRHGYYQLVEFDAPNASLPEINNLLRLMSDLIRHQILKCVAKTIEEKKAEAKIINQLINETANESITKEPSKKDRVEVIKATTPKASPAEEKTMSATEEVFSSTPINDQTVTENKTEESTKTKNDHKPELSDLDLDDKLNQILNTDSLL